MSSSSQSTSIFGGSFAQSISQNDAEDVEVGEESINVSDLDNSDISDNTDDPEERENVKRESLDDDIDILSVPSISERGYKESEYGDIPHIRKENRTAASAWKHYTKKDRDVARGFFSDRQKDLTRHLVSVHGLSAIDLQASEGLDFRYTRREHWTNRSRKEQQIINQWTQWPNEPEVVPRRKEFVWKDSFRKKERWYPSRELEEDLFGFMLKKARDQWNKDVTNVDEDGTETKQCQKRKRKTAHLTDSENSTMHVDDSSTSDESQSAVKEEDLDRAVVSIDDDHNRRILHPIIRSTISQFDKLLISLDNSSKSLNRADIRDDESPRDSTSAKTRRLTSQPTQFKTTGQVDWSQVLGIAAISGSSPEVVARATSRCATMLNEEMEMQTINDDGFKKRKIKTHHFTAKDYRSKNLMNILEVKDGRWSQRDLRFGCPISTCPYPRPAKDTYWTIGEAIKHMSEVHGWKNGIDPPSIAKEELTTVGGLKTDGFLLPIDNAVTYVPGPLALKRIKQRPSGRQKRQTETALDDLALGATLDIGPRNQDVLQDLRSIQPTVFDGRHTAWYKPVNGILPPANVLPIDAILQERTVLFGKQLRRVLPGKRPPEPPPQPSQPSKKASYLDTYLTNTFESKRSRPIPRKSMPTGPIFGKELDPYVVNPRLFHAARANPGTVRVFNEEREERLQRQEDRLNYEGRFARGEISPDRIIWKNTRRNEPGVRSATRGMGKRRERLREFEDFEDASDDIENVRSPNSEGQSGVGDESVGDDTESEVSEAS